MHFAPQWPSTTKKKKKKKKKKRKSGAHTPKPTKFIPYTPQKLSHIATHPPQTPHPPFQGFSEDPSCPSFWQVSSVFDELEKNEMVGLKSPKWLAAFQQSLIKKCTCTCITLACIFQFPTYGLLQHSGTKSTQNDIKKATWFKSRHKNS